MASTALGILILVAHPVAALFVIALMVHQYRYRKRRKEMRGQEAKDERVAHEEAGEKAYILVISVVALGLAINFGTDFKEQGLIAVLPSHVHGWFGIMGLILMTILVRKGRLAKAQREAGDSFALEVQRHGRAADIIVILMAVHAFLGFLYLFQLLR
jgi:protein-S-isoprenylcysteine O-methyltransferase Ste14